MVSSGKYGGIFNGIGRKVSEWSKKNESATEKAKAHQQNWTEIRSNGKNLSKKEVKLEHQLNLITRSFIEIPMYSDCLTVAHLANQIVYRKTTTHTHTCEARMFVHWSECVPLPVCTFNPYEYGEWAEFLYYNTWYVWWCTLNLVKSHFVCTFWLHTVFINVMHKHLMFDVKVPPSLRVKAIAHWQCCLHEFKVCLFFSLLLPLSCSFTLFVFIHSSMFVCVVWYWAYASYVIARLDYNRVNEK